jgi:hypothetical protein
MTRATTAEKAEAMANLQALLRPGDEVHCILRHRARSGMQRVIQLVLLRHDAETGHIYPLYIGYDVARALGYTYNRDKEGVMIRGAGMDMGEALVRELARTVFADNPDRDPGYLLTHHWL